MTQWIIAGGMVVVILAGIFLVVRCCLTGEWLAYLDEHHKEGDNEKDD